MYVLPAVVQRCVTRVEVPCVVCKEYLEWMVDWLMLCSEVVAVVRWCCGAVAVLHFTAQTLAWQTSHYSFNHSAADTELLFRGEAESNARTLLQAVS